MSLRSIAQALTDAALSDGARLLTAVGSTLPQRIGLDDAVFFAPLKSTLIPARASSSTSPVGFTRTSVAYVADHEGILRLVASGEARFHGARRVRNYLTELLTDAAWSKSNCTVTGGVADPVGGFTAFKVTATAQAQLYNTPTLPTEHRMLASVWLRRRTGSGGVGLYADSSGSTDLQGVLTSSWQRFVSTSSGTLGTYFSIILGTSGDEVDVWRPQYEDVTGRSDLATPSEYVSSGFLADPYHGLNVDGAKCFTTLNGNTVASNVVTEATGAAISDATLLGYLAEGSRTNLLLRSQEFDNASWSKVLCTITPNAVASPDGTVTADKLIETAVGSDHSVKQAVTKAASALTYTYTVFAKAGERTRVNLYVDDTASMGAKVGFDLAGGQVAYGPTAGVFTSVSASITAAANGFYRCSITFTTNTATTVQPNAVMDNGTGTGAESISYSGDGVSGLYLWGAQLEQAVFASSYIATTTGAVTRQPDVLTYPCAGNVRNAQGALYVSVACSVPNNTPGNDGLVVSIAGSGNYRLILRHTRANAVHAVTYGTGASVVDVSSARLGPTTVPDSLSFTWGSGGVALYKNGAPTASDAQAAVVLAEAQFALAGVTSAELYGTTRDLRIYDYAKTAAQVAAIPTDSALTGRARWSRLFSTDATLKGVGVPGNLARGLTSAVERRATRCYYSLDGGSNRVELTPGELDYSVAIAAGQTLTFDADFSAIVNEASPWIAGDAGEGITILYDDGNATDGVITGVVSTPAAIAGVVSQPNTIVGTVG